jgi:rod shape-determining protein MreC
MKILLSYLINLKEYLIYSLIVIISLILIFQNDNIQLRFIRAIAVGTIGIVQSGFSIVPNIFEIEKENNRLRIENIRLSNEISQLKESRLENMRLNQLLNLKPASGFSVITARIIGKTLIQTRNTITLNIGENEGIQYGMPVITEKGLVGRIVGTSSNYSVAQILLNKELKVSAKDQRSRVDGIIFWSGVDKISMRNVSKSADVQVGDIIITSEYSNNFPPGIPIGYVVESGSKDNLFKDIKLETFVNFETVEEVFVIKYISNEERQNLEKRFIDKNENK